MNGNKLLTYNQGKQSKSFKNKFSVIIYYSAMD